MRKMIALCLSTLFILSALSGCGKTTTDVSPAAAPTAAATVSPTATPAADKTNYPVSLTKAQLADFQTALASKEDYGFLLSSYSDVRDADLMQVFYSGAGMQNPENSDKIIEAYAATYGEDQSGIGSTILTTKQLDDFLSIKTGYKLTDMKKPLSWSYVKEYDAYVNYHGDTNYIEVSCTDGREISEDTFEVNYKIPNGMADSDGNLRTGGTVTVKNMGDKMQFVSNVMR